MWNCNCLFPSQYFSFEKFHSSFFTGTLQFLKLVFVRSNQSLADMKLQNEEKFIIFMRWHNIWLILISLTNIHNWKPLHCPDIAYNECQTSLNAAFNFWKFKWLKGGFLFESWGFGNTWSNTIRFYKPLTLQYTPASDLRKYTVTCVGR